MASTLSWGLGFDPIWYIADFTGRPLAGGYLATRRSLDPDQIKLVYEDPAGQEPWPYVPIPNVNNRLGILFDANGSQGPFWFQSDSANPQETYLLEVYDSNGNLQWTVDDYLPSGSGGGSVVTEVNNLSNQITNNIMWRNIGASANPVGVTFLKLSLGAHAGFAQTASNAGPDICFIKNNTAATDQLTFVNFTLGPNLFTPDTMPPFYLNYVCGNAPAGETAKYVQFPITSNVQNLSNTEVTVSIWAQCSGGNNNLTLQLMQFFGDGAGATPSVVTPIATQALTANWVKYAFTFTIPSVVGDQRGPCFNDGIFLQVQYPLGAVTNINFTKPSLYIGSLVPLTDFEPFDYIDAKINSPRTGYVYGSYDLVPMFGYVAMNDGTIGSASSGATSRANNDVFPLYNWLYTNVTIPSTNTLCVVTGYTGNPVSDFSSNFVMNLPVLLGRALASAGTGSGLTARALASIVGAETVTLIANNLPAHTHAVTPIGNSDGGGSVGHIQMSAQNNNQTSTTFNTAANSTTNTAFGIMQPTSFMNYFIKL